MLTAAAAMAQSSSQLNYTMIPASHQHDAAVVARRSLNHTMAMNNTSATTCMDSAMNHSNNSNMNTKKTKNGKRRRKRTAKTSQEAENRRMTHIAAERNRRKQMSEHLHVLRSLMPASYVQRGDQASVIGGAIEFVRELEQLLQSLEVHKLRILSGPPSNSQYFDPVMAPSSGLVELNEESAEIRSNIADVVVKLIGFDASIKILTKRRPGQLIKAISGLQELEFTILHTTVTTIEQTALYLFIVKIGSETKLRVEDIASSVQQIVSSIHANSSI